MPPAKQDPQASAEAASDVEETISAIAGRVGFRASDVVVTWDNGQIDSDRPVHILVLSTRHAAHSVTVQLDHDTLITQDRWRYVRLIDGALSELWRRSGYGK